MVVIGSRESAPPPSSARDVIWHDLECGRYREDLPFWRELAGGRRTGRARDPILEIGAGSGRVALDLARGGHQLTALDLDCGLLEALSERAGAIDLEVVCADARTFELGRQDFGLCIAPMQTVQLLGGEMGRLAFLRRARAHLRPGGVLACAITTDFECFDCSSGGDGPAAEVVRLDGTDYVSRAIRVSVDQDRVLIERARRVLPGGREPQREGSSRLLRLGAHAPTTAGERDVIELDLLSVQQLEREGAAAGLRPGPAHEIEATDEYLGSRVVMLHA